MSSASARGNGAPQVRSRLRVVFLYPRSLWHPQRPPQGRPVSLCVADRTFRTGFASLVAVRKPRTAREDVDESLISESGHQYFKEGCRSLDVTPASTDGPLAARSQTSPPPRSRHPPPALADTRPGPALRKGVFGRQCLLSAPPTTRRMRVRKETWRSEGQYVGAVAGLALTLAPLATALSGFPVEAPSIAIGALG